MQAIHALTLVRRLLVKGWEEVESHTSARLRARSESRGTATSIGVVVFMAFLVTSAGVVHTVSLEKVEQEANIGSTIEAAEVQVLEADKLRIVPLIGSDIDPDQATVRVTFPDSEKDGFEITNLDAALQRSSTSTNLDVWYVRSGTKDVPIYKNVRTNYYELRQEQQYAGTMQVERTRPVYHWSRVVTNRIPVYEWSKTFVKTDREIDRNRPGHGYVRGERVGTVRVRTGYENTRVLDHYDYSRKRVTDGIGWKRVKVGSYPTREKVFSGYKRVAKWDWSWSQGLHKTYRLEKQYRYKTIWKPIYSQKPYQKYRWVTEKKPVYKTVKKAVYRNYPTYRWSKTTEYTRTQLASENPGAGWSKMGLDHYEMEQTRQTKHAPESPGSDWTRGKQVGTHSYTVEKPVYKTVQKRVLVDSKVERVIDRYKEVPTYRVVTRSTESMAFEDADGDEEEDGTHPSQTGLDRAREVSSGKGLPFLSFLNGNDRGESQPQASDVVAGVGGTLGGQAPGMWVNGESFIVDLAENLIEEDDLVRVQVIDDAAGGVLIDRTVRAVDLPNTGLATQQPIANPPTGSSTTTLIQDVVDSVDPTISQGWKSRSSSSTISDGWNSESVHAEVLQGTDSEHSPTTVERPRNAIRAPARTVGVIPGSSESLRITRGGQFDDQVMNVERIEQGAQEADQLSEEQHWSVRVPHYTLRVDRDSSRVEVEWGTPWNPVEVSEDDGSTHGYMLGRSHDIYDWMNEHGANLDETPIVSDFADHLANDVSEGTIVDSFLEGGEWAAERFTGKDESVFGKDRYQGPDSHIEAVTESGSDPVTVSEVVDVVTDSTKKVGSDTWEYGSKTAGAVTSGRLSVVNTGGSGITSGPNSFASTDSSSDRRSVEIEPVVTEPVQPEPSKGSGMLASGTSKILDELPFIGGKNSDDQQRSQSVQAEPKKSTVDRVTGGLEKAANSGADLLEKWSPW